MAITFNLVPTTAAASKVFVEQEAVQRKAGGQTIPHKIIILGQYNTGKTPTVNVPRLVLSEADAWDQYGRGSMLALMYKAASRGAGVVPIYALPVADDASGVAATGTIAISGTATADGTLAVYVAGRRVAVAVASGDTATAVGDKIEAAVNALLDLPVTADNVTGTVTFTVRWKGESGNQIKLESNRRVTDATPAGITATVTAIAGGDNDPAISTALGNLGNTWYTEIACPYLSADALTALEAAGVARNDPGVMRQFAGFVGYTDTLENFLTALGLRNSEWTTMVPVHGSPTPAFEIAASVAGVFAAYHQATPGRPVKNLALPGVEAGGSGNDLTYASRNTVVLAGGSHTYDQPDGTVTIGDLCTTRTTTAAGADTDDWRFTDIIPNIQYKIYQLETTLRGSPFDRGVVLADGGGIGPTYGIRPSTVKAYAIQLVDGWIERGISTNRDEIVAGITAEIDAGNPGRINLLIPDVPSAGLRVLAAKLEWDFVV